ncbi:MAG: hypothetical protein GY841_20830 [FCB group bacterium]|nr:hypothetical protein [FCB group bacterium]
MRKKEFIAVLLILAAPLIFWGCGDDEDCLTCSDITQLAIMFGQADIDNGELEFYGYIIALDAFSPAVDSAKVNGHLAELDDYIGENGSSVSIDYDGPAGSLDTGDEIEVIVYTPTGICRAMVTLLDQDADKPIILGWASDSPYDTVTIGSEIVVTWNKVAHADWYLFYTYYRYDSLGTETRIREEIYITDTTQTILASQTGYNGYMSFDVVAMTGPHPDSHIGNVTGGVIKGIVRSTAYEGFRVYIGDGQYDPMSQTSVIEESSEISISEILMKRQLSN